MLAGDSIGALRPIGGHFRMDAAHLESRFHRTALKILMPSAPSRVKYWKYTADG